MPVAIIHCHDHSSGIPALSFPTLPRSSFHWSAAPQHVATPARIWNQVPRRGGRAWFRGRCVVPSRVTHPPATVSGSAAWRGRIGARLRKLRMKKFELQEDFVDALSANGVDTIKSTVSGWETGRRIPPVEMWPQIAETLDVSVRSLIPPE